MSSLKQEARIPRVAENLFYLFLPKELRELLVGDLYEEFYQEIIPRYGPSRARWWYRGQVLKSIRFYILNRKGDIMFFLFSIFVFIALSIIAAVIGGTGVSYFVNIPSLILVIIPPFIFAVAPTSMKAWILGLKLLLIDQDYSEEQNVKEASRFLKVFGNLSLILGIFYTFFGAIQILNGFSTKGTTTDIILQSSNVCVLTLFYGIAIKSILYVADQRLCNKYLS